MIILDYAKFIRPPKPTTVSSNDVINQKLGKLFANPFG